MEANFFHYVPKLLNTIITKKVANKDFVQQLQRGEKNRKNLDPAPLCHGNDQNFNIYPRIHHFSTLNNGIMYYILTLEQLLYNYS